jgi:hypothetical protein
MLYAQIGIISREEATGICEKLKEVTAFQI